MRDLAVSQKVILPSSPADIEKVRRLETESMLLPQTEVETLHTFHAGLYARTIMLPAGNVLTGALLKVATVLIISGDAVMYTDGEPKEIHGYHVFSACAGRKQAFLSLSDTWLTMMFATDNTTVEDVEKEFTDEVHLLVTSREQQ